MMARIIYFLSLLYLTMPLFCTALDGGDIEISFSLPSYQVLESNGPAQPVLRLSRPVDCCSTISVWVYVEEINAKLGKHLKDGTADYYSESHMQVLFPSGTTTAKFDVHMIDEIITVEITENFRVSIDPLSLPYGVVLGEFRSAEVNIMDNDETEVSFDKSTYDVSEGDGGVDLTLQLSRPLPIGFVGSTFQLQLVDVNDHNATTCDYGSMYTVPIPIETTSFTYNFPITDDDVYEMDESFKLQIVPSTLHRQIKRRQPYAATINIFDDEDRIGIILTTNSTIDESSGDLKVDLSLYKPSPCCFHVYVETIDKGADGDGVDYAVGGENEPYKVVFPAGTTCSSFEIPIINDMISEPDEEFTVQIIKDSIPFGFMPGYNTMTDVKIIDDDIYLMFSSETYKGYEHELWICVTVTHDKPALRDTTVEILQSRGTATSGVDYEEGIYTVTILKGQMNASYCISITNDTELEMDEVFSITINNQTAVDQGVILMEPYVARVTIMDDEYTFCFDRLSYATVEDVGSITMPVALSRELPFEIQVKFVYKSLTALGNDTAMKEDDIDYYTSVAYPTFHTIPPNTTDYMLTIDIVNDTRLENNELFQVTPSPEHVPDGHTITDCRVDVIIMDDDDIVLEFESDSYIVEKNEDIQAVIVIKYPTKYEPSIMFPIMIRVDEIDDTATEADYIRMNYTYNITNGTERITLPLISIDDNIVEADETYYLVIEILPDTNNRVITNEAKNTTKIIIYNDDASFLSYQDNSLMASKPMEFPVDTNATVNIKYKDDQHNMTTVTITRNQARKWISIPLPVSEVDVENIVVDFPCKFKSTLKSGGSNVQPSETSMVPINVTYHRCD